ncbi:MAG TPA: MBL fold metallo-hydrolase [Ktedonobacterales bacterium]|nr:MBL fold metallo-hydrolase [Ktedonobacterales bacterium]
MPALPSEGSGQRATAAPREEEGGVEEVAPGIWRITMPLPFALRWVNAYLLQGDGEHCLIDAGLATPDAEAVMLQGLAAAGISPAQLSTIVLTHAHPDHIGLAGRFQQASGAAVLMLGMESQRMLGVWSQEDGQTVESVSAYYIKYGMPPEESALEKGSMAATRRLVTVPRHVTPLEEGQKIRLAGALYEVIWTPGHADGHMCLWRASEGLLIAGDHILPRISPNISLYPNSRPNPLQDYLASLAKVRDLPARLVLPGHGLPLSGLAARVDELARHHQERIEETMQIVAAVQGAVGASAYAVAKRLFAGRFDSLQNRRFAFAEALAHLEYLRFEGRLAYREEQGIVLYRVIRQK